MKNEEKEPVLPVVEEADKEKKIWTWQQID